MAPTAPAKRPTPATPPASVSRKKGKTVAPPPKPTRKNNKKNDKKNDKENNDPEYVPGSDESDSDDVIVDKHVVEDDHAMEDITNSPGPSTRKRAKPKTVITKKSNLVDSTITNLCVASQSHLKTKLELKRMEIAASLASKEEQEAKQETINLQLRWVAKLQQVEAGLPADMKPRFYETVFDSVHEKSRAVDLRVKEHELALKKVELDLKEAEERISKLTMASKKDTAEEANKAAKSLYDSLMEAGK